MKTRIKTPLKI